MAYHDAGDRSRGICTTCERPTDIEFRQGKVELPRKGISVEDLKIGFCLDCGDAVYLPAELGEQLRDAQLLGD